MKATYPDSFGDHICGKDIASVNGNTVIMTYAHRRIVDSDVADEIKADLAKIGQLVYGEQYESRKLLVAKATDAQIEAKATREDRNTNVYHFADGSFIEWSKYGHQAFAPSGWNITPR